MKKEVSDNLLNLVKANYQNIASNFDVTRKKEIWPEVRRLVAEVKKGAKVLDIGCGNGRLLETLKSRGVDYLGIDNSQELIKLAKQNYPQNRFIVGDLLNLGEISEGDFDYIFCLAVLPHIPGEDLRVKALRELKSKTVSGGKIIISAWNLWQATSGQKNFPWLIFSSWITSWFKANKLDFGDLIFPWKNSQGQSLSDRYYHAFTSRELRRLVKRAGFGNYELKKDKFNYWLILN